MQVSLAQMALCCSGTPGCSAKGVAHRLYGAFAEEAVEQALEAYLSVMPCCLAALARRGATDCGYVFLACECVQAGVPSQFMAEDPEPSS